jgi:hypothetical protein
MVDEGTGYSLLTERIDFISQRLGLEFWKDQDYSHSKSDLERPDCRMMLWRVPRLRRSCNGKGTVTVVPSVRSCMMRWLPCWRAAANPCCSRILQTSEPERTRSLPNGHLNLRDENFTVQPLRNFRRRGGREEEREGFDEIGARFLDG